MKLQHLRFFIALVDCGGVVRAAERLRISQPSISAGLNSLLKKVFEVSLWATLIQDPSARRTKDSQPSAFGFEYCASHVRFRVFQQTASRSPTMSILLSLSNE